MTQIPSRATAGRRAVDSRTKAVHHAASRALRGSARCGKMGCEAMQTALRLLDRDMMDRQRALDAALGQIERSYGKGSEIRGLAAAPRCRAETALALRRGPVFRDRPGYLILHGKANQT